MDKKELARHLYLTQGKTQKEIAAEVGVSERTIYTWIHQYAWNKLKLAAYQAPAAIVQKLSDQLLEMQNVIAAREPGKRLPTLQEAEITRKLIVSIESTKKTTSLAMNIQVMESFKEYVRPLSKEFSRNLSHFAGRFLNAKAQNGYAPYQVEHGVDPVPAVTPFYDELEGDEPYDTSNPQVDLGPCESMHECKRTSGCKWPKCSNEYLLICDDPEEGRVEDKPWAPLPPPLPVMPEVSAVSPEIPQIPAETIDNK